MFFYLSKTLWLIFQPSSFLMLLTLLGLVLLDTRFRRAGRRLAFGGVVGLLVLGFSPLGNILILPLEERFPRTDLEGLGKIDGIVVLGGGIDTIVSHKRGAVATNEAAERMIEAMRLARRWPAAKILFSGGSGNLIYNDTREAVLAKKLFVELGLNSDRFIMEQKSRNTYENAVQSFKQAKPKPGENWLLITSAFHMARAMGCFRAAGFRVEAWPVDYRTRGRDDIYRFFTKPSEGLRRIDLVSREWLGLIAYRVTGRIQSVFPAP